MHILIEEVEDDASAAVDLRLEARAAEIDRPRLNEAMTAEDRIAALEAYYNQVADGEPIFEEEFPDPRHVDRPRRTTPTAAELNMVGKRFGRWLVTGVCPVNPKQLIATCDCGRQARPWGHHIRRGRSKGCCSGLSRSQQEAIQASPLTGAQLAAIYDVSQTTISRIRSQSMVGRVNARMNTLRALGNTLAMSRNNRKAAGR